MEKFYFERPSLERKKDIEDFLQEFADYNSDINGAGGLDRIFDGYTFEQALERCLNMENVEFAKRENRCPGKTFLLVRKGDNLIVGCLNLRWNLNEEMLQFAGHIGYGIRPTERRKGYNKINLYLGLKEAKKMNLDRVMLGCDASNVGSEKTMQALGGVLKKSEIDPSDGILTNVYWFDVDKCLEEKKNEFLQFLL